MEKTFSKLKIGLYLIALIGACSGCHRYPKDVLAVLKSQETSRITALTIYGFCNGVPFSFSLSESNTLAYFTKICRNSDNEMRGGSATHIKFVLNNGDKADLDATIPANDEYLTVWVYDSMFTDGKPYTLRLTSPVPKELEETLSKIRTSWKK